jgi:hypothetical protein
MSHSVYVFDNAAPQAGTRFTSLQALFDPVTFRNLEAAGIQPGWRCLEAGAGGDHAGSTTFWTTRRSPS